MTVDGGSQLEHYLLAVIEQQSVRAPDTRVGEQDADYLRPEMLMDESIERRLRHRPEGSARRRTGMGRVGHARRNLEIAGFVLNVLNPPGSTRAAPTGGRHLRRSRCVTTFVSVLGP